MDNNNKFEIGSDIPGSNDETVALRTGDDATVVISEDMESKLAHVFAIESEKSGSSLQIATAAYYKNGKITKVCRVLLIEILKKHLKPSEITPDLFENKLPQVIEGHIKNMGYDMEKFREKFRSV